MGHLFTSITLGSERREQGRLVNSSVVFPPRWVEEREGKPSARHRPRLDAGRVRGEGPFDINQSDSVAWHTAAPQDVKRARVQTEKFSDGKQIPEYFCATVSLL